MSIYIVPSANWCLKPESDPESNAFTQNVKKEKCLRGDRQTGCFSG